MKCPRCGSEEIVAILSETTVRRYLIVGDKRCAIPIQESDYYTDWNKASFYCSSCQKWKGPLSPGTPLKTIEKDRLQCPRCGETDPKNFQYVESAQRWCGLEIVEGFPERDYDFEGSEGWGPIEDGAYECSMCCSKFRVSFKIVPEEKKEERDDSDESKN